MRHKWDSVGNSGLDVNSGAFSRIAAASEIW